MEPTLLRFYAEQAREWLRREQPHRDWSYTARGCRITFERRYQLRFDPDHCRWQLLHGSPRRWTLPRLEESPLSLVDWLRQIRRLESARSAPVIGRASSAQSSTAPVVAAQSRKS